MKASPLLVRWHEDNAPVYSAAFEPGNRGRLATGGGDNNVRIWKIEGSGDDRRVSFLAQLKQHAQAVNVVRWSPKGDLLTSAGDDGIPLLWHQLDNPVQSRIGDEGLDEKEHWKVKTMCRTASTEIYDLAWSPDGNFFIAGCMDNVARIYSPNGSIVRQLAEHNHYIQGVAWDPLNEYVATQSSDRSVHIYTLKSKDGHPVLYNKISRMDTPNRRISSHSPAPPDFRGRTTLISEHSLERAVASPAPSAPGTPQSLALPMNPPPTTHSRRSSFGSSIRRSVSPSPSLPLPAVMPSASPLISSGMPTMPKSIGLYANETFTSFFRRLTFAPDGSLLFTPAGQQKEHNNGDKAADELANMTYIYTRAGLNRPPVAKLPGHKKPSLAVKCSPIYYNLRTAQAKTKEISIDTGNENDLDPLPEPVIETKAPHSMSSMDPPPPIGAPSPAPSITTAPSPRISDLDPAHPATSTATALQPMFDLPYRMVYAIATQDTVYIYDTQQKQPLCVVSNLHYATFTDMSWTNDGSMLLITSSDGFCSCLTFSPGELGVPCQPAPSSRPHVVQLSTHGSPSVNTPSQTPTQSHPPPLLRPQSSQSQASQSPFVPAIPASPARSMSISSVATQDLHADVTPEARAATLQTPQISSVPSLTATNPSTTSSSGGVPLFTPPQTPGTNIGGATGAAAPPGVPVHIGLKREGDTSQSGTPQEKRRRIAPTLVSDVIAPPPPPPSSNLSTIHKQT